MQIKLPQTTFSQTTFLSSQAWILDEKPDVTAISFTQTLSAGSAGCQPTIISLHPLKTNMSPLQNDDWKTIFLLKWSFFRGHSLIFSEGYFLKMGDESHI